MSGGSDTRAAPRHQQRGAACRTLPRCSTRQAMSLWMAHMRTTSPTTTPDTTADENTGPTASTSLRRCTVTLNSPASPTAPGVTDCTNMCTRLNWPGIVVGEYLAARHQSGTGQARSTAASHTTTLPPPPAAWQPHYDAPPGSRNTTVTKLLPMCRFLLAQPRPWPGMSVATWKATRTPSTCHTSAYLPSLRGRRAMEHARGGG